MSQVGYESGIFVNNFMFSATKMVTLSTNSNHSRFNEDNFQ